MGDLTTFSGPVTKVRFTKQDSGFSIFDIMDEKLGKLTLKGRAPDLSTGIVVSGQGTLEQDARWGAQVAFRALKRSDEGKAPVQASIPVSQPPAPKTAPAAPGAAASSAPATATKQEVPESGEIEFAGKVQNVRFTNNETGFTIFELADKKLGKLSCKGETPPLSRGVMVSGTGTISKDPKWGLQVAVTAIRTEDPDDEDAIVTYLAEQVPNIGPAMAKRLVNAFGPKTMEVIRNHPERLREVPGIGPQRADSISASARELIEIEEIYTFLRAHDIGRSVAMSLYREYGKKTIEKVKSDPWVTADHIDGIGFPTADKMAASLGMGGAHPGRLRAGLIYTIKQGEVSGHTGMTRQDLLTECAKLLELDSTDKAIDRRLEELLFGKELMTTTLRLRHAPGEHVQFIQRWALGHKEARLAERILELISEAHLPWSLGKLREAIGKRRARLGYPLSTDQEAALTRMMESPVSILTGGPGTGKTTLLGLFLSALQEIYPKMPVALCAPTGKAAQRMKESVGGIYEAYTTHRLLGAGPGTGGKNTYNRDNPLPHKLIVADESSMYDTHLAHSLVEAIDDGACLLLVGDTDQLPSIGPGSILGDLISSETLPVSMLTQIHRQAAMSKIITNAHAVNRGDAGDIAPGDDFTLIRVDESEQCASEVQRVYGKMLERGILPEDIMVLTSGHKAATGTMEVNEMLRSQFNPAPQKTMKSGKVVYGVGDRIIVIKNNYTLDVRNGQLGMVVDIDYENNLLIAEIEGARIEFPKSALDQIRHGYCITIHKSQGSQAPYVIMLVDKAHYMLLERSLVYTGITRAAKHCVLITRGNSLEVAVKNKRARDRRTALFAHLQPTRAVAKAA